MSSRKIIDIANSLEFVRDYNASGISGNNARISTSDNGEFLLYSDISSSNSTTGTVVLYNGGLSIANTTNSTSYTSGGGLTVRGGASFEKDVYIGSNLYIGTSISTTTITTSNLLSTNVTASTVNLSTGITSANAIITNANITSLTANNILATTYTGGNMSLSNSITANGIMSSGGNVSIEQNGTHASIISFTNLQDTMFVGIDGFGMTGSVSQATLLTYKTPIAFYPGASQSVIFQTNGNVGIGTSVPTTTLDIFGTIRASTSLTTGAIYATNSTTTNAVITSLSTSNLSISSISATTYTGGNIELNGKINVSGSSSISSISASKNDNVLSIQNTSVNGNSAIEFQSDSGSAKLFMGYANNNSSITDFLNTSYILSDSLTSIKIAAGNKTSTPIVINANDNSLSIATTTDANDIYSGSLKISGGASVVKSLFVGGVLCAQNNSNTLGNIFTTGGNVGIGVATPSQILQVGGGGRLRIANTTSDYTILGSQDTDGDTNTRIVVSGNARANGYSGDIEYIATATGSHLFYTTNSTTERMRLTSAGNLGIGTASPAGPLHVVGTTDLTSTTVGGIYMGVQNDGWNVIQMTSTTGSTIHFSSPDVDYEAKIDHDRSNSSLNIITNNNTFVFASSGNFISPGDVTGFSSLSDKRLKTNIKDIDSQTALNVINELRPVDFNWGLDIFNINKRGEYDVGFIAQEVEDVLSVVVTEYESENGIFKALKHERIIPYLVGAIKRLTEIINCKCNCKCN